MYTLDSTHGLRTSAHTADQAVGILGRHLTDCRRDGGIDWLIVTATGRKLSGFINVAASPMYDAHEFIAEELAHLRRGLPDESPGVVWVRSRASPPPASTRVGCCRSPSSSATTEPDVPHPQPHPNPQVDPKPVSPPMKGNPARYDTTISIAGILPAGCG
jgi:hypothetical protein